MTKKIEQFIKHVSIYGTVQVAKEDTVLTILLTGNGLSKMGTVIQISKLTTEYFGEKYPNVEVMKNDDSFYLLILKPSGVYKIK